MNELKSGDASMQGQAAVIRAQPAVLRATVHVTRKATGLTETYEVVGTEQPQQEHQDGGNSSSRIP